MLAEAAAALAVRSAVLLFGDILDTPEASVETANIEELLRPNKLINPLFSFPPAAASFPSLSIAAPALALLAPASAGRNIGLSPGVLGPSDELAVEHVEPESALNDFRPWHWPCPAIEPGMSEGSFDTSVKLPEGVLLPEARRAESAGRDERDERSDADEMDFRRLKRPRRLRLNVPVFEADVDAAAVESADGMRA